MGRTAPRTRYTEGVLTDDIMLNQQRSGANQILRGTGRTTTIRGFGLLLVSAVFDVDGKRLRHTIPIIFFSKLPLQSRFHTKLSSIYCDVLLFAAFLQSRFGRLGQLANSCSLIPVGQTISRWGG